MSALPRGWVEATLGQVTTKIGSGATPTGGEQSYKASGIPLIRSLNVHFDGVRAEGLAFLDEMQAAKLNNVVVEADDVLLNITGASIGRVAIASRDYQGARVNQHVSIIRLVQEVLSEYARSFLASPAAQDVITRENYGATRQALTKTMIEDFAFPLPPLAEQKRIVAKLDALNAKSARARTELARIDTLVSRYKQAVLSKAFSGELSRSKMRFGQFIETAGNGLSKREGDEGNWINVLRLTDLNQGKFAPEEPRQIRLTSKEVDKYRLTEGDLVVIRVNGSANLVGRSFCFNASDVWAFCDHFIRIRLKSSMDPEFTALFLNSPPIRGIIEHKFVSTSGQKTISQKTLEELPAPLIPLEEQHEVVRRIESAFAKIDRLAKEAKRALELVGRLDEAILAKAFRGELVPQDEGDEPAEHLLARIRAERDKAPKARRGRQARS